ncbi:hypothetical protein Noc_0678 [Nitrosococcus oceani ATCC 19707]|uniref:Uncharacterized protein n=1 Tax=Nitrosococcus oceani (strain ATCC 19707 / BCRC 17464 / JCM 30415 / NCIMB 11848 / C-107) TaxID=323261 RepID=Q3JD99_NITOC|nr:hypothetical protein [Nitrosococcus oceani]ABA57197.1 hypothetical protein Noc_0678 [Nitrosococcus oceani ATCC 19707]GEM21514.1 hypothetical protein NONS58_29580 [Nitrosococcus oceani]
MPLTYSGMLLIPFFVAASLTLDDKGLYASLISVLNITAMIALFAQFPLVGRDGNAGQFNPRLAECRLIVDGGLSQKIATIAGAGISMNSL